MKTNTIQMIKSVFVMLFAAVFLAGTDFSALSAEEVYTWSDCVVKAMENHPDLKSAREKINQAKADTGITRSTLLPQIDANAGVSKSKSRSQIPSTSSGATETYSYGISGKQLLFDGTKSIQDLKSARKKEEESAYDYQAASATVRLSLRNAFIQLLNVQESLVLGKEIVAIRKKNFELVRMRYKAGIEHRGSLLTAEANLAQAELDLLQAQRNLTVARHNLVKQMGLKEYRPLSVKGDMTVRNPEREKPDVITLALANPSLRKVIAQREAAKYDLLSANAQYSPSIYGVVSADRTGSKWPPDNNEWSAGVEMSLNLFGGGETLYSSKKAEAAYRQLEADETSKRNSVIQAIEEKWSNLQNNVDSVAVQMKYLNAVEERAKIADAQYSIGTIVFDTWIIIQNNLVEAKKNFLTTEVSALTSEAEWIQSKGGMLRHDD